MIIFTVNLSFNIFYWNKFNMHFRSFFLILSVLIQHAEHVTSEGNCSQITTSTGELELQNVTEALLTEYANCLTDVETIRFIRTNNFTLKELLGNLPLNHSDTVTELYIQRGNMLRIFENAFKNFSDIKKITIKSSEIETLDAKSFSGLSKLIRLSLERNKIRTLGAKSFSWLQSLKCINLSFNGLVRIPSSVFYELPNLQELYLFNNRLKHIAEDAFVNIASLAIMFKIHLQNNQLEDLPYKLLSKVPVKANFEIKARNNSITNISDGIIHVKALAILNVGFNKLKRVSKKLAFLPELKYIYLNNNSLQTLPEEMLHVLNRSDGVLHLGGNPLKCDCRLYWMITFIQRHNITKNIVCNSPRHVKMVDFNADDLQCNNPTVKDTLSAQVITGIAGICVLGLCCVATTVVCLWKTKVNKRQKAVKMVANRHYYQSRSVDDSSGIPVAPLIDNTLYGDGENLKLEIGFTEKSLYGTLKLGKLLGRGAFGDVHEGFASGFSNTWKKVAVKKIKENATQIEIDSLLEEYQNLIEVGKHQNIVQVYGTGLINGSRIMVMELADNGDLLSYIRKLEANNRKVIQNLDRSEEKYYITGKHPRLFMYMWQVAKGMHYLTQMKIVHRDLAARNILLTKESIAKISDFGLSRDVYETGYYFQESKGRLPYKWMSPETLSCGKYTTRSDVWSYGVLLWEVVTLGSSPYPGIPPNMLINMYNSGYIMPQPPLSPNNVYSIMRRCWQHIPEQRPDFKTLLTDFEAIVQAGAKESYLDVTTTVIQQKDV